MRHFAKCLVWSTLVFVLVFALAVASLPWWGPVAFQRWIPVVLENHGFKGLWLQDAEGKWYRK